MMTLVVYGYAVFTRVRLVCPSPYLGVVIQQLLLISASVFTAM